MRMGDFFSSLSEALPLVPPPSIDGSEDEEGANTWKSTIKVCTKHSQVTLA